nr:unnamed protein product [Digitaria exilis]
MVGSDIPPCGHGVMPGSPEQTRKGKGIVATVEKNASALVDVDGAMAWLWLAAAGALWAVPGRNCGILDDEERLAVILALRHTRFEKVDPDETNILYSKKQKRLLKQGTAGDLSNLSSFLISARKQIRVDSVAYQATIPEWVGPPGSEQSLAEYKNDNLQRMGTMVKLPPIIEPMKTRKTAKDKNAVDDKCKCSLPGSEACVRVHVKEACKGLWYQLGGKASKNLGLDAMGERVLKLWTAEDKEKLADIEKLVPQDSHEDFMEIALKKFKSERTMDLASYYYNIFLPKRLASLNRAEATNTKIIVDNEGNNQDEKNNVHRSEEESKGSGSSSRR